MKPSRSTVGAPQFPVHDTCGRGGVRYLTGRWWRIARRLLPWGAAAVVLASCVDGGSPVAPDAPIAVHLQAAPIFAIKPTAAQAAELTRARVAALAAGSGVVLDSVTEDIDPQAGQWSFDLTVDVSSKDRPSIVIQAELASVGTDGSETVQWSGRTAPFTVTVSATPLEIRSIRMLRGPPDNLSVTAVDVSSPPSSLFEGESATLHASLQGGGPNARVYYESLDPGTASVDGTGRVTALRAGTARIEAVAGPASQTVSITVDTVTVPSAKVIEGSVAPQIEDAATRVTSSLADAAAAKAISSALGQLATALAAGQGKAAVTAFQAADDAWSSYGAGTDLRRLDGPQLSLIEITLIETADALGIPFE